MAPIYTVLQLREVIQPPRHPNGNGEAILVEERINLKTFVLLFVGTVCIFILGVLYWKLGTFLRSFTRSRVTGGGKSAASHHVRAWYGWVPVMDYNYQKERWKGEFNWVRRLMVWKSSHANYSWVWWDPGGEISKQRAEDEGRLRRIPLRLMRYAIHGLRPGSSPQVPVNAEKRTVTRDKSAPQGNRSNRPRRPRYFKATEFEDLYIPHTAHHSFLITTQKSRSKSFDDSKHGLGYTPRCPPVARRTVSDGHQGEACHVRFHYPTDQPLPARRRPGQSSLFSYEHSLDEIPAMKSLSWKYRAWGARMQCQTFGDTPRALRGHAGRPGTAMSFAIRSMMSSGSGGGSEIYQSLGGNTSTQLQHQPPLIKKNIPGSRCALGEDVLRIRKRRGLRGRPPLRNCLSGPEVRLVDNLDRKLEWLLSETDPGRKSFAFLLLHNHWLNRGTWVVMDPSSRISVQKKRLQGDPRVNTMAFGGTGKAPMLDDTPAPRPRTNTPRLDSWRVEVNRARASSGTKEIQRVADLLEGSADEAADNNVDPASWILRKPQQGNGMSNKQKETYFEGPGGWSEKLDYWQHVPRLYRLRRAVLQGKANRRCVIRTGKDIRGGVEKAARKAKELGHEQYSKIKHPGRSEKSGRGVLAPRNSPGHTLQPSRSVVNIQLTTDHDPRNTLLPTDRLARNQERDDG
ncbi:hypothetical protein FQN49_001680 [Arthroderma sp. PD_2]|nr:hypothetical protein FQN49_001680 [Arthroderma sp. PD_2]